MTSESVDASAPVAKPTDGGGFFASPGRYRTIAHMLQMHRASIDVVAAAATHPLEISQFLVTFSAQGSPRVEVNEQARLEVRVVVRREAMAGEGLTESDIDLDSAEFYREDAAGGREAFFYCWTEFFEQAFCFDFRPAHPEQQQEPAPATFPLRRLLELKKFDHAVRPMELLPVLAKHHWPPAPCYFPAVFAYTRGLAPEASVDDAKVIEILGEQSLESWLTRVNWWAELGVAARRRSTLTRGMERHFAADYISATHIFAAQIEGLMRDHLHWAGQPSPYRSAGVVDSLRKLVAGRSWVLGSAAIRNELIAFVDREVFARDFADVVDLEREISRHGVAHGLIGDVDSALLSWRFLALIDGLVQMLLLDRVASGKEF